MTYSDLKLDIADLLNRKDVGGKVEGWVRSAEAAMNRKLDTSDMDVYTVLMISGGQVSLPADFLSLSNIEVVGSPYRVTYLAPDQLDGDLDAFGSSCHYTIQGRNILLYPAPEDGTQLEIRYQARIEPLSDGSDTNWVLDKNPDAYLYGSAKFGAIYLKEPDLAAMYAIEFERAMSEMNRLASVETTSTSPQLNAQTGSVF